MEISNIKYVEANSRKPWNYAITKCKQREFQELTLVSKTATKFAEATTNPFASG